MERSTVLDARPKAQTVPRRSVGIALLGCGTVGSGVLQVLSQKSRLLEGKLGCPLVVRGVAVRDLAKPRGPGVDKELLTGDAASLCADPSVDVVVEVMGGIEPARTLMAQALRAGKPVVTANKACLAAHWDDLVGAAREGGGDLYIEAAVCAGIPLIQSLKDGLAANRIRSLLGILNGTCNYILTRMSYDGWDYPQALAEAQRRGFAETDPTLDVEGHDAAQKLAILASLAFGARVRPADVATEGISALTALDLKNVREYLDSTVKLLAVIRQDESGMPVEARVAPCILSAGHLLASVDDAENAVWINGDVVGSVMFFGPGAGSLPTASAVVSDLLASARDVPMGVAGTVPGIHAPLAPALPIQNASELSARYYLRITARDLPW